MTTYSRLPVSFEKGEGIWLWDTDGRRYLDALSGVAVCSLGHAHPAVANAISEQASTLVHTSNWYGIPLQEKLAERLCRLSGMENAFFCNSGAEANEAAIKIARLSGHAKGIEKPVIIVMDGSFHGRTMATLSATGNRKVHAGFEPLVQGFSRVPYNDIKAIEQVGDNSQDVVAVMVEPVLGEGGVVIPDAGYLQQIRAICDQRGWLMIVDEIQTGMARTGQWFACQHDKVIPDVMTLAKALGNGVPIGACLAKGDAASLMQPGNHGSTYGGNPLAARAALAVIDAMEEMDLPARARQIGDYLSAKLSEKLTGVEGVVEIRHKGMMLAIELDRPCFELVQMALDEGLLINVAADNKIRLLPPLIIEEQECDQLVDLLVSAIRLFLESA